MAVCPQKKAVHLCTELKTGLAWCCWAPGTGAPSSSVVSLHRDRAAGMSAEGPFPLTPCLALPDLGLSGWGAGLRVLGGVMRTAGARGRGEPPPGGGAGA